MKAKVTISRTHSNNGEYVAIEIISEDHTNIIRVEMEPEAFGNCVTGISHQDAKVVRILTEKQLSTIDKKRILKDVKIPKDSFGVSWNITKDELHKKISELPEITSGEWELFRDGIGTKQPTDFHVVTLCKYEDKSKDENRGK